MVRLKEAILTVLPAVGAVLGVLLILVFLGLREGMNPTETFLELLAWARIFLEPVPLAMLAIAGWAGLLAWLWFDPVSHLLQKTQAPWHVVFLLGLIFWVALYAVAFLLFHVSGWEQLGTGPGTLE